MPKSSRLSTSDTTRDWKTGSGTERRIVRSLRNIQKPPATIRVTWERMKTYVSVNVYTQVTDAHRRVNIVGADLNGGLRQLVLLTRCRTHQNLSFRRVELQPVSTRTVRHHYGRNEIFEHVENRTMKSQDGGSVTVDPETSRPCLRTRNGYPTDNPRLKR